MIDILNDATEKVISRRPGFVSVTILASADRSRVINIARWEHPDDVRATQADPEAAEFARRVAAVAAPHPGVYTAVAEFSRHEP